MWTIPGEQRSPVGEGGVHWSEVGRGPIPCDSTQGGARLGPGRIDGPPRSASASGAPRGVADIDGAKPSRDRGDREGGRARGHHRRGRGHPAGMRHDRGTSRLRRSTSSTTTLRQRAAAAEPLAFTRYRRGGVDAHDELGHRGLPGDEAGHPELLARGGGSSSTRSISASSPTSPSAPTTRPRRRDQLREWPDRVAGRIGSTASVRGDRHASAPPRSPSRLGRPHAISRCGG